MNLATPLLMLPHAHAALPGFAIEDGSVCSAHDGGLPDAPAKTETRDCQCPFCAAQDAGHVFLPGLSGPSIQPLHRLAAVLPDLAQAPQGDALDQANRARAPPRISPTA